MKLLIADYAPTRMAVRHALDVAADVCIEAGNTTEAIAAAERELPEICFVGLELPGGTIEAVRGLHEAVPDAAVIVLAGHANAEDLLAVLRAGAIGYVTGGGDPGHLRSVVRAVQAGEAVVPRKLVLELVRDLQDASAGGHGLTPRERQVLGMLRQGASTAAIATRLQISPVTVRRHVSTLLRKVGATDRTALSGEPDDAHSSPC